MGAEVLGAGAGVLGGEVVEGAEGAEGQVEGDAVAVVVVVEVVVEGGVVAVEQRTAEVIGRVGGPQENMLNSTGSE